MDQHAAMEADIEEGQNERLLSGLADVLSHIDALEHRILELEQRIVATLDARGGTGSGAAAR